ncbi:MAG: pyruvate, phosphate dikinase [Myxococcales bacterium]|nr:pyruvate, phosphate dikinase [Myxococcales bacterium]
MRVYTFGNGTAEGRGDMVAALGAKGAGLAEMSRLGVPVPPGFTLVADACRAYFAAGRRYPEAIRPEIARGVAHVEAATGLRLGDPKAPLLVSVRSGASVSMPGMMDTVLNVGLSAKLVDGLAHRAGGNRRFALDSHRRFLRMYAAVLPDLDPTLLPNVRDAVLGETPYASFEALPDDAYAGLLGAWEKALADNGAAVPVEPLAQIEAAIIGVFQSWNTRRAINYRRTHGIPDELGTAVTVQAMVFGNLGPGSATGVAFTRHPNTGEPRVFGEYLPEAQGEDVVSGAFTPLPLAAQDAEDPGVSLEARGPAAFAELTRIAHTLEGHFRDVQDIEFTIERGHVWMLQTRTAKRSARASVRTAVDMARDGLISTDEALLRVRPERLTRLLHPSVDLHARRRVVARGLPASPGAVSGVAIFDPDEAVRRGAAGEAVVLVRIETAAEDMDAIRAAVGVLTSRGGMTSHAALVARGLGRVCVTGCADIIVDERAGRFRVRTSQHWIEAGTALTIDGGTGEVILGEAATTPAAPPETYAVMMEWADARRRLSVRANADHGTAAERAREHGADGVGLCCTEHMFLDERRVTLVRSMVLAPDARVRKREVEHILPQQRRDFRALFEAMPDRPVAVRLLDLQLHDFMPSERDELEAVAARLDAPVEHLITRARLLRTDNPLLGHRGCRLGLTFPELYEVQMRALIEASVDVGGHPDLDVVIPLVTCAEELRRLRRRLDRVTAEVIGDGTPVRVRVGAMIESPQACLVADELAAEVDFFLFGTNDLTIATYCLNRDDAGRFLPFYLENEVLPADPFVRLDERSVGRLIEQAIAAGRRVKPGLPCGLAGVHAGQPDTVEWAHRVGIDYVTCAPHRVPIARLAAAQAAIREEAR